MKIHARITENGDGEQGAGQGGEQRLQVSHGQRLLAAQCVAKEDRRVGNPVGHGRRRVGHPGPQRPPPAEPETGAGQGHDRHQAGHHQAESLIFFHQLGVVVDQRSQPIQGMIGLEHVQHHSFVPGITYHLHHG